MNIQEYLEVAAGANAKDDWPYNNIGDFVLKEGQKFKPYSHPLHRGLPKECFKNAFNLMLEDDRLTYVEGFAMGIIPVLHAWCVTESGKVIDPTWLEGSAYFGVKFNRKFVTRFICNHERYGVIDSWDLDFPLLSGKETGWRAA